MRGLMKLGKTCNIEDPNVTLNKAQQVSFDLHHLDRCTTSSSRQRYLKGGDAGKYIFLYHACSANAQLHVFALFVPEGVVKLFLVDPASRRQPISRLQDLYKTLLQKKLQAYGPSVAVTYPSSLEFSHSYHSTDITALKTISRELGLWEDKSFIVVVSSGKDQSYFERWTPKLAKFPTLT